MYSDINKCFLQFMLSEGCVDSNKANEFIAEFSKHTGEEPKSLLVIIRETNEKIGDHLYKIVKKKCEITGKFMYCLINMGTDNISSLPGEFSIADYEYFGFIISEIMLSGAKHISMITCLNLATKVKQGKDLAQKKINRFCRLGYIIKENGQIYLGPRGIAEYEGYLKSQYENRITVCNLCKDDVYYGNICAGCNETIHKHCFDAYNSKELKCPVCKEDWVPAMIRTYDLEEDSESDESDLSNASQLTQLRQPNG